MGVCRISFVIVTCFVSSIAGLTGMSTHTPLVHWWDTCPLRSVTAFLVCLWSWLHLQVTSRSCLYCRFSGSSVHTKRKHSQPDMLRGLYSECAERAWDAQDTHTGHTHRTHTQDTHRTHTQDTHTGYALMDTWMHEHAIAMVTNCYVVLFPQVRQEQIFKST